MGNIYMCHIYGLGYISILHQQQNYTQEILKAYYHIGCQLPGILQRNQGFHGPSFHQHVNHVGWYMQMSFVAQIRSACAHCMLPFPSPMIGKINNPHFRQKSSFCSHHRLTSSSTETPHLCINVMFKIKTCWVLFLFFFWKKKTLKKRGNELLL